MSLTPPGDQWPSVKLGAFTASVTHADPAEDTGPFLKDAEIPHKVNRGQGGSLCNLSQHQINKLQALSYTYYTYGRRRVT